MLRRTKDKVLTELPPKTFRDAEVELSAAQRQTYQLAEEEGVLQLTEHGRRRPRSSTFSSWCCG